MRGVVVGLLASWLWVTGARAQEPEPVAAAPEVEPPPT